MKSVALNKINEIRNNSNRPKYMHSHVNNYDTDQQAGSEKNHFGGYNLNDSHKIDEH